MEIKLYIYEITHLFLSFFRTMYFDHLFLSQLLDPLCPTNIMFILERKKKIKNKKHKNENQNKQARIYWVYFLLVTLLGMRPALECSEYT